MPEILCLIAARGGSKRLPGKNIMALAGKPLIVHSIEQAKAADLFADIAVSSDDEEILSAAKGANILIKRPAELATDSASSLDVIIHAIKAAEKESGKDYDAIVFLQATSPLRLPEDIKKAVELFYKKPISSLVTVVKIKNLIADGEIKDEYQINGSIYIWDKRKFLIAQKIIYPDTKLIKMTRLRSVDIDYKSDFDIAETLMRSGEYRDGESVAVD